MSDEMTLRELRSADDLQSCLRLQQEIWGEDMQGNVPPLMLKVVQEAGGLVAGAFNAAGAMAGFLCGLAARRHGRAAHWSHMLGVSRTLRDHGLGQRLKWFQREWVLATGVDTIYWTFDPLEARNAHLNFNRLGVGVDEYRRDFYEGVTASPLHAGIGTDRLVVGWPLANPHVVRARDELLPENGLLERYAEAPVVNERGGELSLSGAKRVRIEIPDQVQALKVAQPKRAIAWRRGTRTAFEHYFAAGYVVKSFYREPRDGRCFYCLRGVAGRPGQAR